MKCKKCKSNNVVMVEYPSLYDGWIEMVCQNCKIRVGRWSGKILADNEHENPDLRFSNEK
jgi:hypothetical protein